MEGRWVEDVGSVIVRNISLFYNVLQEINRKNIVIFFSEAIHMLINFYLCLRLFCDVQKYCNLQKLNVPRVCTLR